MLLLLIFCWKIDLFFLLQWEALALLLIGISVNQLRSLPEGTTALGLPVTMGAYIYTLIFVSDVIYSFDILLLCYDFKKNRFSTFIYLISFLFLEFLTWKLFCRSLFHHWPLFIMSMLWRANMIQAFICRWCMGNC